MLSWLFWIKVPAVRASRNAGVRAAQEATPVSGQPLPDVLAAVMDQPRYAAYTQLGIYVADRETGEAILDLNSVRRYVPGSTTKLFPAAAALTAYGPGFRFETPVYRRGNITDEALDSDLDALPVLGVDGTEWMSLPSSSPALGKGTPRVE